MPNRRDVCPQVAEDGPDTRNPRAGLHLAVIFGAIVVSYYGVWNAYFSHDDYWMFGRVRFLPLSEAIWAEAGYAVRMLLDVNMWVRVRLFQLDAAPYYYCSLLQHAIVTVLVYCLAVTWTRRPAAAFVAGLVFGTTFANRSVVTWIVGSEYSLTAIFYLTSLGLFGRYVRSPNLWWLFASFIAFSTALLVHESAASLPLVLVAYHFMLGRRQNRFRWPQLWPHLPFWTVLGCYGVVQVWFILQGTSEAHVSEADYGPGLHVLGNLYYLGHLVVPNVHDRVMTDWFGPGAAAFIGAGKMVLAVTLNGIAIVALVKGSPLVRFLVIFCYLAFLPFTLWHGRFAGAGRYLYLPAVGYSILLGLGAVSLCERFSHRRAARGAVAAAVALLVLCNAYVNQVWVRQHVENGEFRRVVVEDLAAQFARVAPESAVFIQVPKEKYLDLGFACELVFREPPSCAAFVAGREEKVEAMRREYERVYCVEATADGIRDGAWCVGARGTAGEAGGARRSAARAAGHDV